MNGTISCDEIQQFLEEQFAVVVEGQGAVTIVCLIHHSNGGASEVSIHAMGANQGSAAWGKPAEMAALFSAMAERHARGIAGGGQQQFTLAICRGDKSGKPTAVLPFTRVGSLNISGPTGLGTEPPNSVGAMSQGMRLLEIHAQGNFGLTASLATAMSTLVEKLSTRLEITEKRSDERWLALQNLLLEWQKTTANTQLRALGVEFGRKLMPLVPAMLSTMTGSDLLVSTKAAEASIFDALVANYNSEQLADLLGGMAAQTAGTEHGGALQAMVADQLVRAQKRRADRAEAEHRLMSELPARSYEEAERDAAGEAVRALRNESPRALTEHANGHASSGDTKPPATKAAAPGGDDLLDVVLSTVNESEVDMLVAMLAAKRPDQPDLARRIRERFAAANGGPNGQ